MRIRAVLLMTAIAATVAAPLAARTHTVTAACHTTDRWLTMYGGDGSAGSSTVYYDDRGQLNYSDLPPEVVQVLKDNGEPRLPAIVRSDDAQDVSGTWVYLESNQHAGLQTGGEHAVLGETGTALGETDPCRATHNVNGVSVGYDAILL